MFVATPRSFSLCCALLLACAGVALGEGEYQKAKDGKTTVWNSTPKAGDSATWFGERDSDGYATGVGTLTWYTGSGAMYARYYGNMVHGKLDGAVNVHIKGRTAHAYFTEGTRTSPWAGGVAPSRRVPPEFAAPEKRQVEKENVRRSISGEKLHEQAVERPKPSPSPESSTTSEAPAEKVPEPPKVASTPNEPVRHEVAMESPSPIESLPSATPTPKPSPPKVVAAATPKPKPKPPAKPTVKTPPPSPPKSGVDNSLQLLIGPPASLRTPSGNDSPPSATPAPPSSRAASSQLSKEDAILLADAEARSAGYDLNDYHRPKTVYDSANETWGMAYDRKRGDAVSAGPAHFSITVDDKTKKAAVASPR